MHKMKRSILILIFTFCGSHAAWPRALDPIVTTQWLQQNLKDPGVTVLDIRTAAQYEKGHIPGSVSTPLSAWAVSSNGLSLELPSDEAIRDILGKAGVTPASKIVIASRTETDFGRADATRVAWTCKLAGIESVAVLDGGFTKWARENKALSTEKPAIQEVAYSGKINRVSVASKAYVLGGLKRLIIADNRVPEDYFGITSKPGHIRGAVNLPTPWVFNADGTFRAQDELRSMASGVLGDGKSKEIVVYCGVGGYSSTWWFLLTQVLGYRDVKIYDGSFEEWIRDPAAPARTYTWH